MRYDGRDSNVGSELLTRLRAQGRVVTICPEVAGGLPIPRPPAEILGGDGHDVLAGEARVLTATDDVTDAYVTGARRALELAQQHNIKVAILKARSPSCGVRQIYDGTHSAQLRDGAGVTAALLREHGIEVFDEEQLTEAAVYIAALGEAQQSVVAEEVGEPALERVGELEQA